MVNFRNRYPSWFCGCLVFIIGLFTLMGCQPEGAGCGCRGGEGGTGFNAEGGGCDANGRSWDAEDGECDAEGQDRSDKDNTQNSSEGESENSEADNSAAAKSNNSFKENNSFASNSNGAAEEEDEVAQEEDDDSSQVDDEAVQEDNGSNSSGSGGGNADNFTCGSINFKDKAELKFYSDFDNDGDLNKSNIKRKIYNGSKIGITSIDSRLHGGKSIRFDVGQPQLTHSQCNSGSYRSEVVTQGNFKLYPWDDGQSYWIGVSFNPQDFQSDAYSFLQIHAPMPEGSCDYDGNSITIKPRDSGGRLYYEVRVIENGGKTANKGALSNSNSVYKTPMNEGQWSDFIVNFSLSSKGKGFVRIWNNGKLVYQKCGLTNVNHIDSCGNKIPSDKRVSNGPHVGIYGPACSSEGSHRRELLADNIRVAQGGSEGYNLVDPSKNRK